MKILSPAKLFLFSLFLLSANVQADVYVKAVREICDLKDASGLMPRKQCIQNAKENAGNYLTWLEAFNKEYNGIKYYADKRTYAIKEIGKLEKALNKKIILLSYLPIGTEFGDAVEQLGIAKQKIELYQYNNFEKHMHEAQLKLISFQNELK